MQSYQILTIIGAVLGIIIAPLLIFLLSTGNLILSGINMEDDSFNPETWGDMLIISVAASVVVSIAAIVSTFMIKTPRIFGIVMLGFAAVIGVTAQGGGAITWILFGIAGIIAIRRKESLE